MTDLCFQMKADVANVDVLMSMIRSTALTNYIHLDGQTQALHLINPAGFITEYLMPSIPTTISWGKTDALNRGFYHGVAFNIPGAEVYIDGEWIAYDEQHKEQIKAQNPFNLQWRLNGNLIRKYGYKPGDTLTGTLVVVDDEWNGLNITKEVSIQVTE